MTSLAARRMKRLLIAAAQFCLFQAAWFACVLGAAHGQALWGVAAIVLVVLVNLVLSDRRAEALTLTALAVLIGLAWDTWMLRQGWVRYAAPGPLPQWAPGWILALWALFATLLTGPLSWLHGRPLVAAALGAVGGPMSYLAAVRLGAGQFPDVPLAMAVLAVGWGVMTPMLTEAARLLGSRRSAQRRSSERLSTPALPAGEKDSDVALEASKVDGLPPVC